MNSIQAHMRVCRVVIAIAMLGVSCATGCKSLGRFDHERKDIPEGIVQVSVTIDATEMSHELNDSSSPINFEIPENSVALIRVLSRDQGYEAMISPNLNGSGQTGFSISYIVEDGNSGAQVKLENGFAIFRGSWPIGTTDTVGGSAQGTTMIVQDGPGSADRVFLIEEPIFVDDEIEVYKLSDRASFVLLDTNNRFIQFPATTSYTGANTVTDSLSGEMSFSQTDKNFVKFVQAKAKLVGLPD